MQDLPGSAAGSPPYYTSSSSPTSIAQGRHIKLVDSAKVLAEQIRLLEAEEAALKEQTRDLGDSLSRALSQSRALERRATAATSPAARAELPKVRDE